MELFRSKHLITESTLGKWVLNPCALGYKLDPRVCPLTPVIPDK